jgi:phage antirepressor YoqD-like protein
MNTIVISGVPTEVIAYQHQPVITTKQLAEFYGCEEYAIRKNFNNNKERFEEGKHYFKLVGSQVADFVALCKSLTNLISPHAPTLMLWTAKGAARHAKMLSTEKAWEVFEQLEEAYFSNLTAVPKTFAEALRLAADTQERLEALQLKIEADRPKLEFAEIVAENSNTRCVRVWVKAMKHENNLTVGEQRVFKWLLDSGYIFKNSSGGYLPYSKYEANGANYFTVVVDEINGKPRQQLKITGKGVVALTGKVVKAFHTERDNAHAKPKLSLITNQAAIAKIACLETKIHQRTMVIGGLMTENSRLRAELKSNSLEQSLEPDSISKTGSRE